MQATAANLDRLVDSVWAADAAAATQPAIQSAGGVSLARLAAESRAVLAAHAHELAGRARLVGSVLHARARDAQLVALAEWIHAPALAARGPLFAAQLAAVLDAHQP